MRMTPLFPELEDESHRMSVCLGRIPEMWNRNVHYFGNVREMFFVNEQQVGELERRVGGVESHGGRLLPILNLMYRGRGENTLYLEKMPDLILNEYFQDLRLSLPKVDILPQNLYHDPLTLIRKVERDLPEWIDGYVTDAVLDELSVKAGVPTVTTYHASRLGNHKGALHRHLELRGIPVFPTYYASHPGEVDGCLDRLQAQAFQSAAVKSVIGASGVGLQRISTTPGERVSIDESYFFEGSCMVQGWLDTSRPEVEEVLSPSVQVFLKENVVSLFDITEQFLSAASLFKGNECPPSYLEWPDHAGIRQELIRQAEIVAAWLHEVGVRGAASIDFLVARGEKGFTVYVCEANARVTGATYPSLLARHFHEGGAWVMRNLKFQHPVPTAQLLSILNTHRYLYELGMERGLMPYNLYTCDQGRVEQGQFLVIAPEIMTCKGLLLEAERDIPIDWEYERA